MSRATLAIGLTTVLLGCPATVDPPDAFTVSQLVDSAGEAVGTVDSVAVVELNRPAVDPVEVWVETSDETRLYPAHDPFVIDPDEQSVEIDLVVVDDAVISADTAFTVSITALGADAETFSFEVVEDDVIDLQLTVSDPYVVEGSGLLGSYAVVSVGGVLGADLEVAVTVSDASELTAPAAVTVPAGYDEVAFDVEAVDDAMLDFDQTVSIAITDGDQVDDVDVTVLDDESAALTLVVHDAVMEGDGDHASAATVATSAPVEEGLGITVVSSDPTQLLVTGSVWLDPGQASAGLTLTAVDDALPDFDVDVDVTAAAAGCVDAVASVSVIDDESGYAIELMGPIDADEEWVDFGAMTAFMDGTDWAIVERFTVPEGADHGGYQWMRGKAWEDQPGDITGQLPRAWIDEAWEWVPGAWIVGSGSVSLYAEGEGPQVTEGSGWHTSVVQYDHSAEVLYLYVDGSMVAQTTMGPVDDSANTNPLAWGGQWADPTWEIGDLYNETDTTIAHQAWLQRLLTADEIAAYDGSVDLDDPALYFATAIGRTGVLDVSGGERHGTVHGDPVFYRP